MKYAAADEQTGVKSIGIFSASYTTSAYIHTFSISTIITIIIIIMLLFYTHIHDELSSLPHSYIICLCLHLQTIVFKQYDYNMYNIFPVYSHT